VSAERWRGLAALVGDAVEHGSRAVERVQVDLARRPFALLEAIPPLAAPARVVHAVHDGTLAVTHGAIRLVSRAVVGVLDAALDERRPGV